MWIVLSMKAAVSWPRVEQTRPGSRWHQLRKSEMHKIVFEKATTLRNRNIPFLLPVGREGTQEQSRKSHNQFKQVSLPSL